jgi:thiamine-phosphate pyrophosphorylase
VSRFDLSLYGILDPKRSRGRDLATLAGDAIDGGATFLQLRDKKGHTRDMVDAARAIIAVARPRGVPVVINDRVDVALAAAADGVHIGEHDMAPNDARRLLGADAIIGVTVHTLDEARAAPCDIAAYYGVGPVYGTLSKDDPLPPIGVDGFAAIAEVLRARHADCPVVAIAGIEAENAGAVVAAGASGIAVISALFMAQDVKGAARELARIVAAHRRAET